MTQDGDLKPFKIGDMQRPGGVERPRPLRPAEADSGGGYAFVEGLFDANDFQPVLGMYERAMEKLKPIALDSPDAAKKGEAIRTIHAYDRAMELLTRMLQIRQEMEKEGS